MTQFIHWKRTQEFPFTRIVERFEVNVALDSAWKEIEKILTDHGFHMQEHFNNSFLAFPFGESAEDANEAWEGWEV